MTTIETSTTENPVRRRGRSNEAKLWIFMRLSGLVLLFLALFHYAITHIINDVVETDSDFVAGRWDNPLWRVYDWTLLALGLAHGLNGLNTIMVDYIRTPSKLKTVRTFVFALTGILFLYGTWSVVVF